MISTSELESWLARSDKSDFSSDISWNSKSSFSKTTAVNFCIRFWIDAFILLQDSYTEDSLTFFLGWLEFFHQDLQWHLFSLISVFFFKKSIILCWVNHLCASLTEIIAVWLRFLFIFSELALKNVNSQTALFIASWSWNFLSWTALIQST